MYLPVRVDKIFRYGSDLTLVAIFIFIFASTINYYYLFLYSSCSL